MTTAAPSPLAAIAVFGALTEVERAALTQHSRMLRVPAGHPVMKKGEPAESMMVLLEGRLRVGTVSLEGRAFTFRIVEPVQLLGEIGVLDGGPRSADVTSMTPSRLLVLRRRDCLDAIERHPAVARAMILLLCGRLRDTSLGLEQVATQRLPARMAALLLRLAADYGRPTAGGGVQLPMRLSQGEIGTLVAATREAVNKQLMQFRDEGLLALAAGRIEISRPEALAALLE